MLLPVVGFAADRIDDRGIVLNVKLSSVVGDVTGFDSDAVPPYLAEKERAVGLTTMVESSDNGDGKVSRWAVIKDRLAILAAFLVPFILLFLVLTDTVRNGQCNPAQFFMFECNRFDTTFKPWK